MTQYVYVCPLMVLNLLCKYDPVDFVSAGFFHNVLSPVECCRTELGFDTIELLLNVLVLWIFFRQSWFLLIERAAVVSTSTLSASNSGNIVSVENVSLLEETEINVSA